MPWQREVANVGLELDDDGIPAYREIVVSVPRQSGKTTLILSWEIQRAIGWTEILGRPAKVAYSAQTGKDAREKLLDDQIPILEPLKKVFGISRFMRGAGAEAVYFSNGSKIGLLASMEESGHGKTLDLAIHDELFADTDYRRAQATVPAMATRPHAQIVIASTAGTPDSVAWNAKVTAGRAAAEAGRQSGIAYFEWSARLDEDPADPATWWGCMPALGRTIGLPAVEHAFLSMPLGEFRRAWTNVPTVSDEQIIPALTWELVQTNTLAADPPAVFAVDMPPERDAGAIVAGARGDRPVLEVVDYRSGVGWLVDRCAQLFAKYGAPFVLDSTGPVAGIADELERAGVTVRRLPAREVVNGCGRFYDAVVNEALWIRNHVELNHAVSGAAKRPNGDAWSWARKSSRIDISLLVAATVAHSQVDVEAPASPVFAY